MVDHNVETAVQDAEWHLKLAKHAQEQGAPERIAISSIINVFIRGTDALCWHFTGERCQSGSSHDLHLDFERLYTKHDLPEKYAKYKENIRKWVKQEKTKAQYKGKTYSTADLDRALTQAERYLKKCVKPAIEYMVHDDDSKY